jgi:ubiquitin-conjugating enzyme (huntingtin interacting protein 2)
LTLLRKTLKGPDDTPYAGGIFEVDIVIPAEYPFSPPKMKFITKCKNIKAYHDDFSVSN